MIDLLSILITLIQVLALILLYAITGLGFGFIAGILAANYIWGRGNRYAMEEHQEAIAKAGEHNSQWNPQNPRWHKEPEESS